MSEPTPPPAPVAPTPAGETPRPVKQTERPHPLTPLIRGWVVLLAIVVGFGREFIPDGTGEEQGIVGLGLRWILLGIAGIVVLAAAAGFTSWYFTRYVIDDEELRIETGAVFKNSKRVPFERVQSVDIIQQFAARIFGLAELRIEVGAGDSTIKLRYLTRQQAASLRDYLLSRAHGDRVRIGDVGTGQASVLTDLSSADQALVTVPPQRLVVGFLLSSEFLVSVAVLVIALVVTAGFDVVGFALAGLIPLAIGLVSMIGRRVFQMFNFTLAQSARGLRVTRGLFNLTSQSVPVNRIQGIRVLQPILWRRLGWYRVDVNVLGYGSSEGSDNDTSATSVLVPVADARDVAVTLGRILPGFDPDQVELHGSPRRARWLRPFDFWTLRYGTDDRVVITEHGWLTHVRNLVPHAKTQSVRLSQGPLQRRLGLADVHLDITRGPVTPIAHQLDAAAARDLTLSQLDLARSARAADRVRPPLDSTDPAAVGPGAVDPAADEQGRRRVLERFGVGERDLIGSGGESQVYALGPDRVLRIYRGGHEAPAAMISQLRPLYAGWTGQRIGLELPQILDAGEIGGRWFSVDRRMSGGSLSTWLAAAEPGARRDALLGYLDAASRMQQLPFAGVRSRAAARSGRPATVRHPGRAAHRPAAADPGREPEPAGGRRPRRRPHLGRAAAVADRSPGHAPAGARRLLPAQHLRRGAARRPPGDHRGRRLQSAHPARRPDDGHRRGDHVPGAGDVRRSRRRRRLADPAGHRAVRTGRGGGAADVPPLLRLLLLQRLRLRPGPVRLVPAPADPLTAPELHRRRPVDLAR